MIVLLAFLPFQAWAGIGASGAGHVETVHAAAVAPDNVAVAVEAADLAVPASPDASFPSDTAEPTPPGADFAEQLLPPPAPRMLASGARSPVPRYAMARLPDPDLPLLPRPPRG
ncbi:hypothetical protein [Cupriavidus agavae]|uniref:Uncharacterized protein n=1 Tax=Cupriavidus agavae TaxID=1001822 RepID=A0A4Q7R9F3_9BURK|nr:hypothetical protein [Cupriavidus agavae]RZT29603.1 hypothetical protein EV147_4803 [Cupriavidus agavae]